MIAESRRSAVAAMVLVLVGCTPEQPAFTTGAFEADEVAPAVVTRADLISVLTVDAVVVATPRFAVLAEVRGPVQQTLLKPGSPVRARQQIATQGDIPLESPVDGFLHEWLVPHGVSVHSGVPVALIRYAGFGAAAVVPVATAYRLYDGPTSARLQITDGPGPTDCTPLPVAASADPAGADQTTDGSQPSGPQMRVLCALPEDVTVIDGSRGVIGVTTGQARDVLTLPLQAVAGTSETGTVVKLVDGVPVLIEVTLGITDGVRIEIVDGLEEGDQVWPYGPNLRPRLPGRQ